MKVFLVDNDKMTKYVLPSRIDDSFLINYSSALIKDCAISLEGKNNNWYLRSNGNVNIIDNNNEIDEIIVEAYKKYTLKVVGAPNTIDLYFLPLQETLFKLDFSSTKNFTVGSSSDNHIFYNSLNIAGKQLSFKESGEDYLVSSINDASFKAFLNGSKITNNKLKVGDIIFAGGLKIIWMKNYIYINNPLNALKIAGMTLIQEEKETLKEIPPVSEDEKSVNLYNQDDYFTHYPSIRQTSMETDFVIDAPPKNDAKEEAPAILSMGSSIVMMSSSLVMGYNFVYGYFNGRDLLSLIPQMIMCISMIVGSLIFPRLTKRWEKKQRIKKEKLRVEKYNEYLQTKQRELELLLRNELQVMNENYLNGTECVNALNKKNRNFWWRQYHNQEFLSIRVGIGRMKSMVNLNTPEEHFEIETDDLLEASKKIKNNYEYIEQAPVNMALKNSGVTSIVCQKENMDNIIKEIFSQLLILHSSLDLKIVMLTNKDNNYKWEFLKYVPHVFSEDKSVRFYATTDQEAKYVSNYLEDILKLRLTKDSEEQKNVSIMPYYLVITDDYKNKRSIPIIDELTKLEDQEVGFSLMVLGENAKSVPDSSKLFVEIGAKEGAVFESDKGLNSQKVFYLESNNNIDLNSVAFKLANIPVLEKASQSVLPTSLKFLDMFNVTKIEQLNILNRWQNNNPVLNLDTTVGVHPDGEKFKLDLHEKFHGPHGLIAGSTGSGKSEFIITYILSMALNYHPYEVQFVLIDYKGGGLAGAFLNKETGVKIPHLVGTITNLDTAEMNRSLVSIQSELKRRQRIFNEVREKLNEGTIDIYKYQKLYREGKVEMPLSHLFIICDEFAELKQQQPEFMGQLISISRIGRSLGIHLILATQKPTGVVNDQIWANSKFKVCLKVQEKQDSMEMLKRPDAASIKETGRFYLQVGYDDIFEIGQSGWSGAKYTPSDKMLLKVDEAIDYIDNVGYVVKSVKEEEHQDNTINYGDELTNLVRYIYNLGIKENIVTNNLWLNALPEFIFVNELKAKYNYKPTSYFINPVIGEYDDPVNQRQGILNIDLSKKGNLVVYGIPGSGKEDLLMNLIRSTIVEHTPDEVNIYILDCGSETLKIYNGFPHVGGIVTIDEKEKVEDLLNMADAEINSRKAKFVEYGGNYNEYISHSNEKLPLMFIVINNYDVFIESYQKHEELIYTLFRDGYKYGVVFAVTCISTSAIKSRATAYFANKITMRLGDEMEYRMIVNAERGQIPADTFGRGLVLTDDGTFEFQTSIFADRKDYTTKLRELNALLKKTYTTRAKAIPSIPEIVLADDLIDNVDLNKTPIGYNKDTKNISYLDMSNNKNTIITFKNYNESVNSFIKGFVKLLSINNNVQVWNFKDLIKDSVNNVAIINDNYETYFNNTLPQDKPTYNIFVGIGLAKDKLGMSFNRLNELFESKGNIKNIIIDEIDGFKDIKYESWFREINSEEYIWLGGGIADQFTFTPPNLTFEERKLNFNYMGYIVKNDRFAVIKHLVEGDAHE